MLKSELPHFEEQTSIHHANTANVVEQRPMLHIESVDGGPDCAMRSLSVLEVVPKLLFDSINIVAEFYRVRDSARGHIPEIPRQPLPDVLCLDLFHRSPPEPVANTILYVRSAIQASPE